MKSTLLPAVFCASLSIASGRTFTNQKGQTFEGSVVAVDATNAELMRDDGKTIKVALNTLSPEDQRFCSDWRAANPPLKLTVKADSLTAAGTRRTQNSQNSEGGSSSATSSTSRNRAQEEGYRITVSNWSKEPGTKVGGLTVDYAIVIGYFDTTAKDKRGVKSVVRGKCDVPELAGSKPEAVLTQTVKTGQSAAVMTRTQKNSDGGTSRAEAAAVYRESMDGICLVVRQGKRVVATYSTGRIPKELPAELLKVEMK